MFITNINLIYFYAVFQNSQPGQTYTRAVKLFSTNSNGFVRVNGNRVDSLGLKTDESGKFMSSLV